MQVSLSALNDSAINAALKNNWEEAVELNSKILELDPSNLQAKIRLGRAFLQLEEFTQAKKIFKEVLEKDPLNNIVKKNYELAKNKSVDQTVYSSTKSLIRDPGTYAETSFHSSAKETTIRRIQKNDPLEIKYKESEYRVYFENIELGFITERSILTSLREARINKIKINGKFISRDEKNLKIGILSEKPIFSSDRQEVKPYLKKGAIEEPEMDITETGTLE